MKGGSGRGRPRFEDGAQKRRNITLSDAGAEKARSIGNGNISVGIRLALDAFTNSDKSEPSEPTSAPVGDALRETVLSQSEEYKTELFEALIADLDPGNREFDIYVNSFMEDLPKGQRKKFAERLDNLIRMLQYTFSSAVIRGIHDKHPEELARIKELEREAEEDRERAKVWLEGISPAMTMKDFHFVRGCLHPDKHPKDNSGRFNKAFEIFNRLEATVNPNTPLKVLRERGWERKSPRYRPPR